MRELAGALDDYGTFLPFAVGYITVLRHKKLLFSNFSHEFDLHASECSIGFQSSERTGFGAEEVPSPRTMAEVLNRLGYCLRKVVKAKPQKKIQETAAIFDQIKRR
jgi:hypothetical protein